MQAGCRQKALQVWISRSKQSEDRVSELWEVALVGLNRRLPSPRAHRIKTTMEKRKCATPLTMRKSKKTKHVVFHECDNILPTSTAARDALSEFDSILESCVAQDTFELELNAKERALNELEKELAQEKERILGLMTKLNAQAEHLAKKRG